MPKVGMKTPLHGVTPDRLWQLIGGFNALHDWHPAIEKTELEEGGQVRKLSLAGGGTIVERLVSSDQGDRIYTYSIENSPLPVANYTATMRVHEGDEGHAEVEWSSEFEASGASENDAVATIRGIYQAGFDNLKKMFGVS